MSTMVKYSIMRSRVSSGLPDRWHPTNANPVGNYPNPTREMVTIARNVPARVQHPKLNTTPWASSYAVKRSPQGNTRKMRKG